MSEDADSEDDGYCEMELPTLIKQLRSVLDQYPDDGQILKELIQNAEDAEAREVKILFDGRHIQPNLDPKLLRKRRYLAALKAPALCVYNNAQFTEKDWRGIKMLHNSIKEEEPLKVGRFGLGFKSVFHITDIPCIISGDTILFINPERTTEKVCYTKKLQALDSHTKDILAQVLGGTFGFSKNDSAFSGSLFWFPLRAQESKLSETVYTEKKVMDLYNALKAEASITLLFLKSIEEIHLFRRDQNDVRKLFSLKLSSNCLETVRPEKLAFVERVKEVNGKIPASSIQNQLMLEVDLEDQSNGSDKQKWLVINFYKGGDVSHKLRELDDDVSLSYCPYVGLAVPLTTECKGHVFCFLPLPLENRSPTGLALHVNGFFALSQNRRYVKWPTADQLKNQAHTDKAIEWNRCLAYEVLPEVYCNMVQELIRLCQAQNNPESLRKKVYSLLPSLDDVDPNWQPLLQSVLHQISNVKILYTQASGGKWITLQESMILEEENDNCDIISEVFLLYEKNLVVLPSKLLSTLKAHCPHIREVDTSMMFEMLRTNDKYTSLSKDKKMAILRYLGEPRYLQGLQLLPVDDGTFVHFSSSETVYFCEDQSEAEMFPGAGKQLVASDVPQMVRNLLKTFAQQGHLSLALMSPSVFPSLLRRCLADLCPEGNVQLPSGSLNMDWLRQVWGYITTKHINIRETLAGVPLVPDVGQQNSAKLHQPEKLFIAQAMPRMKSLPELEAAALQKLGVTILRNVPDFVLDNHDIRGHVIHYPTPEGVIKTLENKTVMSNISTFNEQATRQERHALLCYMSTLSLSPASKEVLMKMKIFTDTSNNDCAICTVSTLAPDGEFPVKYPETYVQQSSKACKLALTLGARKKSLEDVCLLTLQDMAGNSSYSQEQKIQFMDFLLSKHQAYLRKESFKKCASEIKFLTTEEGRSYFKPCQLFDKRDSDLESLFSGEDQFPDSRYITSSNLRSGLQLIGLKTDGDLTESDLIQTCKKVEELVASESFTKAEAKIKTVVKVLKKKSFDRNLLSPLQDCCCIPRMKQRPTTYPKDLPFMSDSASMFLKSSDLLRSRHLQLVGSVFPVAVELPETVEEVFGIKRQPTSKQVVEHLRNVTQCYKSKENHLYAGILHEIYKFLSSANDLSCQDIDLMQNMNSVWTEDGFKKPQTVYLDKIGNDLNLRPYRFPLPITMQEWKSIMLKIGSHTRQTADMLGMVLQEIKQKHDDLRSSNRGNSQEAQQDLKLIIQIIGVLKDLPVDERPKKIYLPTHQEHSNFLVLLPVSECTFCNADWLRMPTTDDTQEPGDAISYVHADISENTARQLGVCSLTDRVMDDTEDLDMEYEQSEPLTTRLKNLLREYTDGFSVPKELIQNADDAGATEVCFMYDERQNLNARTFLMHEGMSSLQGPAFWAYNNAKFEKADFVNIKKLSGATKEEDTTKVGKFGLGFNSVYNLTDVPSFISENTVAIFDPHRTHLGRGGLRANLRSDRNQLMLRKMHGQFKPFEGVFGCNFREETICQGTLFRFPLRTQEQADCSEIKKLSYSKSEMEKFFQKFLEGCGNLTLFTQNVKSVKFFHLVHEGNPSKPELLVHVTKDIIYKQVQSPLHQPLDVQNVLRFTNEQRQGQSNKNTVIKIKERTIVKQEIFDSEITNTLKADIGSRTLPMDITWATGTQELSHFASSGRLKGLVPLAAVAVALQFEGDQAKIFDIQKCPKGFYSEGHLFCFLPLPIKSNLPVHINAGFALTPDRRQLCTMTEDDKTLMEAQWNEALMRDAVSRAYVLGLTDAPILGPEDVKPYFELWPLSGKDQPDLVKGFYKIVIEDEEDMFVFQKGHVLDRTSFGSIRYLDPKLFTDDIVGDIAFNAAEHFWNNEAEHLAKIPKAVQRCFEDAGFSDQLKSRCLDELEFFQKIFFPHVADSYWSSEERNKLTVYALGSNRPEVLELVKNVRCIPTKPSGTLKKPCELVHQFGRCHRLFDEEDECFVYDETSSEFSAPDRLKVLCDLGMIKDNLPDKTLLERAKTVLILQNKDTNLAKKRFQEIIGYLSHVEYSSAPLKSICQFSKYPDEVKKELQKIPFLPTLQRPSDWKLPWKADGGEMFACASDLYSYDAIKLAGSTKLIIDVKELSVTSHTSAVLCDLGLNQKNDLEVEVVVSQLEHFAANVESDHEWGQKQAASNMCHQLYEYLNEKCCKKNDKETGICDLINSLLGQKKVILTGGKMVYPKQVAFELAHVLSPYLFKIEIMYKQYHILFETLGVRKTFEIDDILNTITAIQAATGTDKLSAENLGCFGRLMQYLLEMMEVFQPDNDHLDQMASVCLPDKDGYLCEASQLCIDDCTLIEDDSETMRFVHPHINQTVANWFGVKGKREADLNDDITLLPFGQREKLTSRLKRILSGYPCDASVMKELLQNADDASATELMFIKDFRTLPNDTVVSERWKELQGPALCVYNNSYFSDKDFAGIQNLGEGSKGDDPVKTGQYGVGFNAVYHLTDVPSFMTVGPGTEKTVCALDPHIRYVPWASKKLPGGRITKLDSKRNKYKDFFAGYLEDCMPLQDKGTMFRFPLRTEAMAAESDISQKEITPQEVEKLLEDFKTEMFNSLLFLHCVKKITIAHVTNDGKLVEEYWVESEMNKADTQKQTGYLFHLRTQAVNIKDHSTGVSIHDISPLETQLLLSVKDSKSAEQNWLIVHRSGFSPDKPLPESLAVAWETGDIGLLPRGGVAVPLPSNFQKHFQGKAFCILPLPIETGLPVHVNGHFALDHEARRNLWHGTDDYRCDWNKHTLEAIIIPAYLSAMQALKTNLECTQTLQSDVLEKRLNLFFGFFPEVSSLPHILWTTLSKCFYKELVEKKTALFPVVKPAKGRFGDYPVNSREPIQQKVTWVALSVSRGFPGHFNTLTSYYRLQKQENLGQRQQERRIHEIEDRQRNIRLLTEILRDLGMKVIEAPDCVYNYFVDAGLGEEVKVITPEHVMSFLKSHEEKGNDKCMIGQLPKNIKDTPLKTITTAKRITDFVAKGESFAFEICGLPLAVTMSETLSVFNSSCQLIASKFSDLLGKIPDITIHEQLKKFYVKYADDCPSLRPLTMEFLTELLPKILNQTTFMTQLPIQWDIMVLTKTWLSRFWQFLEDCLTAISKDQQISSISLWVRNQLQMMSSWSLFPVLHVGSGQLYLYPLTEMGKILNLDTVTDEGTRKALKKLNMPVYESDIWRNDTVISSFCTLPKASHLLGSWERPGSVLFVLSEVDWTGGCPLKESEAEQLLQHLTRNSDQLSNDVANVQSRLINLPLYSHISGRLVPLQDAAVVRESYSLVEKGLEEFEHETGNVLLKYSALLDGLYVYVNYKPISVTEVYSRFLIPQFDCIPSQFRSDHIRFIRQELLKKSERYSDEQNSLITQLKALKFIETSDGTLHRACEFFSKKEAVFSTMLPKEAFLPSPYDQDEWHSFLVLLDLHASVTVDDFVEFAKVVERLGSQEMSISQELAEKSDVLIKHLWSRDDVLNEGILWRIRDFKFLLPYHVGHQHKLGKTLIKIHPQCQEAKHLICFSESVSYKNCFHVWTSSTMLREEADPQSIFNRKNSSMAYSQLGIEEMPSSHVVAKHVQTVCDSVIRMSRGIPIQDEFLRVLKSVMTSIYEYFKTKGVSEQVKEKLETTRCIFLWEEKLFVSPLKVVTDLDSREAIGGYLYKGPRQFAQYFTLFHSFGASEKAKSFHFAQVLKDLQEKVKLNELNPNELHVARSAILHMFTHLEREHEKRECDELSRIETLYLPSYEHILLPSTELIYCDNSELKQKGKKLKLQYFVGFRNIEIELLNPVRLIDSLPDIHRPKRLTQVLKEVVAESCKEEAKEGSLSRQFSDQIKAPEFISGLVRMINDTRLHKGMDDLRKSDCEKIESDLDNLSILEVDNLHTVLTHKGNILEGSGESKLCWTDHTDNKTCIYVASITDSSDKSSTFSDLASAVNIVTHYQLGNNLVRLSQLIATSPQYISKLLNSWKIHVFNYSSKGKSKSAFPPPGSIIKDKFHFMLDNNFGYFEEGEFAGFEVYDPFIDVQDLVESKDMKGSMESEDSVDESDGLFYIYVIIRKVVMRGATPLQGRYLIEGRDGLMEEVSSTQLYKFIREKDNISLELEVSGTSVDPEAYQSQDLKDVLAEIRRTLRDAWENLNEREKNRVKKRLYLKWHPDKNPDRAEFCTEVCKYIAIYVEKLENGQDLLDIDDVIFSRSTSTPDFTWFKHFDARSRAQRNYQERYEENVRSSRRSGGYSGSGYSYHQSARSETDSHPMEAKRWYRQAKADLDAAQEALGLSAAYNWICFKCQQAAEKSLKAMLYNCDVGRADNTRTHDLNQIVKGLGNPALTSLVSQLDNIIKDYNRLRYPDRFSYPTIPADVYTETDARTACSLTQKILSLVETSLP